MAGFFDKYYGVDEKEIDKEKLPIKKSVLKRKFRSAYDDAANKKIDEERRLFDVRRKFDSLNLAGDGGVLELRRRIKNLDNLLVEIKEEYVNYFGVEMKVEED